MSKEYTTELMLDFGDDGKNLLPVVTQHFLTKEVLILAFVNEEAFKETVSSGYATFFSRSRNELWKKGATSGDFLLVKEIRINCEQNSILFLAIPEGRGVCHAIKSNGNPFPTCFYRRIDNGSLVFIEK
jgi:phosphoribosyl-AMP cyclohydrolase